MANLFFSWEWEFILGRRTGPIWQPSGDDPVAERQFRHRLALLGTDSLPCHTGRESLQTNLRSPGAAPAGRPFFLAVPQAHHPDRFENCVEIFHGRTAIHPGTVLHERTYLWISKGCSLLESTCQHSSWTDPIGTGSYWILRQFLDSTFNRKPLGPSPTVSAGRRIGS